MSKVKRKLSVKTLIDKCNSLRDIEKGISNKDVVVKYGVPKNTTSTWVKNKEKYFRALESSSSKKMNCHLNGPGSSKNLKFPNIPLCRTFAISNFFGGPVRVRDSECRLYLLFTLTQKTS